MLNIFLLLMHKTSHFFVVEGHLSLLIPHLEPIKIFFFWGGGGGGAVVSVADYGSRGPWFES